MRAGDRVGPDPEMVAAARAGDERALDLLVAECLPLVYNVVGRALDGHDDVDDVVQETLLRVVRGLADLRDPAAFRSWLVAIAVRQVRDREQARQASWHHQTGLDAAELIPDPASDFASVTILRLGLTDQRREIAEATRWLEHDDRTLLALWWLEETGDIGRSELADALGLTRQHAAVRVQRMKEQLETSRTVVRALGAADGCPQLTELTGGWDGVPSPLWRKRFARHVRDCAVCGRLGAVLLPMDRLLSGLPLLPVPISLAALRPGPLAAGHPPAGPHPPVAGPHASPPPHAPLPAPAAQPPLPPTQRTAPHTHPPRRSGAHRGVHRLRHGLPHGPVAGPAAAVSAVAAVAAGALLAVHLATGPTAPAADATTARPSTTAAAPTTPPPATPSTSRPPSPKPTASRTRTPTPKPTTRAPVKAPAPAATPASSTRKGVGVWTFDGVNTALRQSGASWYYTWSPTHSGISGPGFVPMIWGADSATPTALAQAKAAGPYLLGFNEPDMGGQANMTVDQALSLWPKLESAGKVLGSPAVAYGGDTPGGWLDRFMTGARQKNDRVDFIALHWYGGDFTTSDAVTQLRSYLQAVYDRYHKPIWLTEFALTDFSTGTARYPSDQQQAAFLTAATRMLDGLPYLQRYAWFGLPAKDGSPSTGLFHSGPAVTDEGRAFENAR
ncbi:RNA polymerase sigma factor, sigma-70 family [Actinacidiphila yanglinensis]|uniref:RNA polymerase sigma factor, sigma-70 family n=1 Tax=Actinacidiphila yanglinensis TaxID=310779 RepID=A0A1H5XIQ8_9ACTN|nr:sigma-70 family RNA polymerase sigma factor [Actinacidiphila yanglinensis]SEG11619.1 RNA polymerase sigma factor, sigma-70 family [Actinacidiphila yanglinensis]